MLNLGLAQTVRLVNLSSEVVAPGWTCPVSLLWVDGDHRYEGVRRDIDCWARHLAPGATVVLDDMDDHKRGSVRVLRGAHRGRLATGAQGWKDRNALPAGETA